jgi:hypothetical protein
MAGLQTGQSKETVEPPGWQAGTISRPPGWQVCKESKRMKDVRSNMHEMNFL